MVATDHCPFSYAEQKQLGVGDFTKIPNGLPSLENRMDLVYQGVVAGEISLPRWVEVTSTNPAKMFGLYPKKGVIAPGSDADIVVYDPLATPDDLGRDPPHGGRLLLLRRHVDNRAGGRRVLARAGQIVEQRRLHRQGRSRAASCLAKVSRSPLTLRKEQPWTSASCCRTIRPASHVIDQTRKAEDAGFTHVWTFESCVLWEDTFMIFPGMLAATSKVIVGPDGDESRAEGLDGDRLDVRHDERDVRRTHDLRHGPRRLGASRDRRHADLDEGLSPSR